MERLSEVTLTDTFALIKEMIYIAISIGCDPAGNLFIVHGAHTATLYNLVLLINVLLFLISIYNENLSPLLTELFLCLNISSYFKV